MRKKRRKKAFRVDRSHLAGLIGIPVILENGSPYGRITAAYNFGAGDVVDIEKTNKKTEMLPLKDEFLKISADRTQAIVQSFEFSEAKPE